MIKRVLVFKTSVIGNQQVDSLRPLLDNLVGGNDDWNFDLEDCDNILRVESSSIAAHDIASTLQLNGHDCQELQD